ncbi:MAG TPA: helix-turn-helix transcriptional regulator [Patescibacteria group bacterium]|nr:helix-turn-helix transcriptional regulator [Patescibacteria group bacterium]
MENRVKVYRAMRDVTQEGLAKAVGVSRQTVMAIERGNYNPSLELAFKIARFFGVGVEDVFTYDGAGEG